MPIERIGKMKSNILLNNLDEIFQKIEKWETDSIFLVIDENVFNLYGDKLNKYIQNNSFIIPYILKNPEESKSLDGFHKMTDFFLSKKVHRNSHLICMGGGATSDLCGFVASTLLRGIPFSIIPTTLLSMVDASVGGKTGINTSYGKNLIGQFYKPQNIFLDKEFLKTLSKDQLDDGFGEIIKYAFLSKEIFNLIINNDEIFGELILKCAQFKNQIVERDFFEHGERKILNFGHSFGHGLEKQLKISHGKAVYLGMILIDILLNDGHKLEQIEELRIKLDMEKINFPWEKEDFSFDEMMTYLGLDKKRIDSERIELILVKEIGMPTIVPFELMTIKKLVENFENRNNPK